MLFKKSNRLAFSVAQGNNKTHYASRLCHCLLLFLISDLAHLWCMVFSQQHPESHINTFEIETVASLCFF